MTYPTIRTVDDLRAFMQQHTTEGKVVDDAMLLWFVCVGYARSLSDASIRDRARLFRDGVDPVKTLDDVQKYLDTFWEDEGVDGDQDTYLNITVVYQVFLFFGLNDLVNQVEAQMSDC